MIDERESYNRHLPDCEPSRYKDAIRCQERLQVGARKLRAIHKLRCNKEFREDRERVRRLIGIPPEGCGIREARKRLAPLARAYFDCEADGRGSYKRRDLAGIWIGMIRMIQRFADRHRFPRNQPMPLHIAFQEIIYKRPESRFRLVGYFNCREGAEPEILLEDAVTEAPQPIKRMVTYKLREDENKYTDVVRISNRVSDSGGWEIVKNS